TAPVARLSPGKDRKGSQADRQSRRGAESGDVAPFHHQSASREEGRQPFLHPSTDRQSHCPTARDGGGKNHLTRDGTLGIGEAMSERKAEEGQTAVRVLCLSLSVA